MQIDHLVRPKGTASDLRLWHCRDCGHVHMSVGKLVVNFRSDEFVEFAEAVMDVSASAWIDPDGELISGVIDRCGGTAH